MPVYAWKGIDLSGSIKQGTLFARSYDDLKNLLTQNNIGRYLTSKTASPSSIEKMIAECLNNEIIQQNALNMQSLISEWNTKSRWVQFLNKFKTIRKSKKIIA